MQTSRALLDIPIKATHAVYSVNIASAHAENCKILVPFGTAILTFQKCNIVIQVVLCVLLKEKCEILSQD